MAFIVGNDVSEFQGDIDWTTYRNNTNFVIMRATIGTARVDNKFFRNRDNARSAGLPIGFYHYSYPQYNTAEMEADYVKAQLADIRDGEMIVLDFEEVSSDPVSYCKRFLDRLSSQLNGYKPLIYLNQSQLQGYNWKPISDAGYGLWVAAYTYSPTKNTFVTGSWSFAAMQQWTNKQTVPGISGLVDGDVFFGDQVTFKKYGYHTPVAQPDPRDQQIKDLTAQVMQLQSDLTTANTTITNLKEKIAKATADLA